MSDGVRTAALDRSLVRGIATAPSKRVVILLAVLCYSAFGTVFQIFPPFLDDLRHEFGVGRTVASLSMTAYLVPGAIASLFVGAAVDRGGPARVGRFGFALLLAGSAATIAVHSFALFLGARAIAGLGGGMVLVAVLKLLGDTVPSEQLGAAFGLFIAGLPIGTAIAFDAFNHLPSWRYSGAAALGVAAAAAAAFAAGVPAGSGVRSTRSFSSDLEALAGPVALRQLTVLVVLGYTAIIAFTTWAPTRLVAYSGLSATTATVIASVLLVIDIPFAPLWGFASDRVGRRKPFVVAAFVVYSGGAFLLPAIARGGGLVPILAVVSAMGIGCAMFFPATLAIPRVLVPDSLLGASYGMFLTAQLAGMAAGPLALGAVFQHASTPAGLLVIGAIAAAAIPVSLRLQTR